MFAARAIASMTLRELRTSNALRYAAYFSFLFLSASIIVQLILFQAISNGLVERQRARVNALRTTLIDIASTGSFENLQRMVAGYASDAEPDENVFLLTDEGNNYVAGNLKALDRFSGWRRIPLEQLQPTDPVRLNTDAESVFGSWTPVKGGYLFVAEGDADLNEVRRMLVKSFGYVALLSVLLALGGGIVIGFGTQRRLSEISAALNEVTSGRLSARLPQHGVKDDLEQISLMVNSALDHLQSAVGALQNVTTNIAHDLKGPIGRALQKLEQLGDGKSKADPVMIDEIRGELKSAIGTFELLLRIAEVEAGSRRAHFASLYLGDVLENVVEMLEPVACEAGHQLSIESERDVRAQVFGDRELLMQAFVNLVENAIRHCPNKADIQLSLESRGDVVEVSVKDNGPGIPGEERGKVFQRLYRLEKSRTTTGSGLGLSLVASILELHGAHIALSDNNPGLRVTISFPKHSLRSSWVNVGTPS